MGVTRRKFLKRASGLFVPAVFGLSAHAQNIRNPFFTAAILKSSGEAASCSTTKDSIITAKDGTRNIFAAASATFYAAFFKAGSSYTLCGFDLDVYGQGSPTMTVTPYIYALGTNAPASSALATGTPVSASTLPVSSGTFFKFSGFSLSLTSGTVYWMVMGASAVDSVNFVKIDSQGTDYSGGSWPFYNTQQLSTDGASWSGADNSQARFHTFA